MKKYLFVILILSLSLLEGCSSSSPTKKEEGKNTAVASALGNELLFDSIPLLIDGKFDSITHQGLLYKSSIGGPVIVKDGVVTDSKGNKIKPVYVGDQKTEVAENEEDPKDQKTELAENEEDTKDSKTELAEKKEDPKDKKTELAEKKEDPKDQKTELAEKKEDPKDTKEEVPEKKEDPKDDKTEVAVDMKSDAQNKKVETKKTVTIDQENKLVSSTPDTTIHDKKDESRKPVSSVRNKKVETKKTVTTNQEKEVGTSRPDTTIHDKKYELRKPVEKVVSKKVETKKTVTTEQDKKIEAKQDLITVSQDKKFVVKKSSEKDSGSSGTAKDSTSDTLVEEAPNGVFEYKTDSADLVFFTTNGDPLKILRNSKGEVLDLIDSRGEKPIQLSREEVNGLNANLKKDYSNPENKHLRELIIHSKLADLPVEKITKAKIQDTFVAPEGMELTNDVINDFKFNILLEKYKNKDNIISQKGMFSLMYKSNIIANYYKY